MVTYLVTIILFKKIKYYDFISNKIKNIVTK